MSKTFSRIPDPSSPANNARKLPDDAYVTSQADDAKGSAAEAFALSYMNRLMAEMYRRLTNKDPGNTTPRDYASGGPGHDHDGVNSVFIGTTLCAHARAPFFGHWCYKNAAGDRPAESATFGGGIDAYVNPDAGSVGVASASVMTTSYQDLMVWKDLYCGPGVNRLEVSILGRFLTLDGGGAAGRTIDFRLTTGAGNVDRTVTVPANGAFWAHYHLTSSTKVTATAAALNDLTLRAKCTGATGSDVVAVYGWTIAGAHA
jgi:hypothetical protein